VCCSELQCVAMRCSVLQCVAVCCNVLQFVAVRADDFARCAQENTKIFRSENSLQIMLQRDVMHCSELQCVSVCYSVLQLRVCLDFDVCFAVCCNVSQRVAMRANDFAGCARENTEFSGL